MFYSPTYYAAIKTWRRAHFVCHVGINVSLQAFLSAVTHFSQQHIMRWVSNNNFCKHQQHIRAWLFLCGVFFVPRSTHLQYVHLAWCRLEKILNIQVHMLLSFVVCFLSATSRGVNPKIFMDFWMVCPFTPHPRTHFNLFFALPESPDLSPQLANFVSQEFNALFIINDTKSQLLLFLLKLNVDLTNTYVHFNV